MTKSGSLDAGMPQLCSKMALITSNNAFVAGNVG